MRKKQNEFRVVGDWVEIKFFGEGKWDVGLIDKSDLEKVLKYNWYGFLNRKKNGSMYLVTHVKDSFGRRTTMLLSRFLMNPGKGLEVDHMSHDTLDNRRSNLRIVSTSQNGQNRKGATVNNSSRVRGVSWHKNYGKYGVNMKINGKTKNFGYFDDIANAEKKSVELRRELMPFATK